MGKVIMVVMVAVVLTASNAFAWDVTPKETAKCILELRKVVNEQRSKFLAEVQINPAARPENFMNFQVTPECDRILRLSDKYLDKDKEFTRQVDDLLEKR